MPKKQSIKEQARHTPEKLLQYADEEAGPYCCDEDYKKSRALLAAAPELLDVVKLELAYDEGEPWAVEELDSMVADNEGRDYRNPRQALMFLRRAAIVKAEGK